jgi:tyrosine-specific transport protein
MAGLTLGRWGQCVVWSFYLLLLYSILSAYIAGGGDLFHYLLITSGIHLSLPMAEVIFTCLFGAVVYRGIQMVDYVNRGLMFGKMGAYFLLVILILPFIQSANLSAGEFRQILAPTSVSVTVVAFTCAMVIPSLRTYFNDDVPALRKAILLGTLIPLICYIAWDLVIMGVVPLAGSIGLGAMLHSASANSDLVASLSALLQKTDITRLAKFFTSVCMATSFLSISLCLSDFLSDGLRVAKRGVGNLVVFGATFMPPVLIVLLYPDAFIQGLHYAGISCFVLMLLFPPLMVWYGRYHHLLNEKAGEAAYQVGIGKPMLAFLVVFGLAMIAVGLQGVF